MGRTTKILFLVSLISLILSYPACQYGDRKVYSEMAKYPPDFVAAHQFDLIFFKWALPGIGLFFLGGICAVAGVISWVFDRIFRKPQT